MMMPMTKYLATAVLLLGFWCLDLACGLVLSGPSIVSPPPPSATTYSADSRLYRSYSSPSSVEYGIAAWLASREPNQNVRPFVPHCFQTAQTDTSRDAGAELKNRIGSFADVATVVSAIATSAATVGGAVMATRWIDRNQKRFEREEREAEKREVKRIEDRLWGRQTSQIPCTFTK